VSLSSDMFYFVCRIARFVHRLRPVAVAALVATAGRRAFESVGPAAGRPDAPEIVTEPPEIPGEPAFVVRSRSAGSIQAIDVSRLGRFARQHRCTLVLNHVVCDLLPAGARLVPALGAAA